MGMVFNLVSNYLKVNALYIRLRKFEIDGMPPAVSTKEQYSDGSELKPKTILKSQNKTDMKTTSKISALLLAGSLAAAMQANASLIFTETITGINAEVQGTPYTGHFTGSSLLSGSTVFNSSLYTISSAVIDLTMLNAAGHQVTLTVNASTLNMTPTTSPQVLAYTLTSSMDSYIASMNGTFTYGVEADCELTAAELIVTGTSKSTNNVTTPDAGSSALLLLGGLSALGLMKRKLA